MATKKKPVPKKKSKPALKARLSPFPDPKRPQLWLTEYPFPEEEEDLEDEEKNPPQTNIVYPSGKYEFWLKRKRKWHVQGKQLWEQNKKLDTFVCNM